MINTIFLICDINFQNIKILPETNSPLLIRFFHARSTNGLKSRKEKAYRPTPRLWEPL